MIVICKRTTTAGRYFPHGDDRDSEDYVCDLQQAQYFKLELVEGNIKAIPPLPTVAGWEIVQVEIKLQMP